MSDFLFVEMKKKEKKKTIWTFFGAWSSFVFTEYRYDMVVRMYYASSLSVICLLTDKK